MLPIFNSLYLISFRQISQTLFSLYFFLYFAVAALFKILIAQILFLQLFNTKLLFFILSIYKKNLTQVVFREVENFNVKLFF